MYVIWAYIHHGVSVGLTNTLDFMIHFVWWPPKFWSQIKKKRSTDFSLTFSSVTKDETGSIGDNCLLFLQAQEFQLNWAGAKQNLQNDVCPAKTLISLGIHPVWSESLMSTWSLGSLATHRAPSHQWKTDQTAQTNLSLCWEHMICCRFCHAPAQFKNSRGNFLRAETNTSRFIWAFMKECTAALSLFKLS